MDIYSVGKAVKERREGLGLTQDRLARLANLSRQTVQRLEAGSIKDLSFQRVTALLNVLGLGFDNLSLASRQKKRGLWMAAKTSSVSYRDDLSETQLEKILTTGTVPPGYEAHIGHLLGQAPVNYVVMAVEEAAAHEHLAPAQVWSNVAQLANTLSPVRKELWT